MCDVFLLRMHKTFFRSLVASPAAVTRPCPAMHRLRTTPSFISPFIQPHLDDQALAFLITIPFLFQLFREHEPTLPPSSLLILVFTSLREFAATHPFSGHGSSPPSTSMTERHYLQTIGATLGK